MKDTHASGTADESTVYLQRLVEGEGENPWLQRQLSHGFKGVYLELAKLELRYRGQDAPALNTDNFEPGLRRVNERLDCADFVLPAFLVILNRYKGEALLDEALCTRMEEAVLGYKYWLDEPGEEINHTCFFTENHQALFHTLEYLAGQIYPQRVFSNNGETGEWHKNHGLTYLKRWLSWRSRFGFCEWLSNEYYSEDLGAMMLLAEMAEDETVKRQAAMLMDILLFDMALHSFKGALCGTSGRMYLWGVLNPEASETNAAAALLWGGGMTDGRMSISAVLMAVFHCECADAIRAVAQDKQKAIGIRQRVGFNVEDSWRYGIDPAEPDNIMLYWAMHSFFHRLVIDSSRAVTPEWYDKNTAVEAHLEHFRLMEAAGLHADPDPNDSALTQADIYTYKTPHYMLSCVQDYRKGRTNFQQHIWQASLGGRALVFVTHPGASDYTGRPNYFVGNGIMPKATAYKNILISIHRIPPVHKYLGTHAYFPVHEFDEFTEKVGWLFGRKGDGYIALRPLKGQGVWKEKNADLYKSMSPATWEAEYARASKYEYWVAGHANAWICEMGDKTSYGNFNEFVNAVSKARVEGDTFSLCYDSPSLGLVETGWQKPFKVAGKEIATKDYPRYDTPYCKEEFDTRQYKIECSGNSLALDFNTMERCSCKRP